MTKVFIVESEAGWGIKVDEVKEFPDFASAKKFVIEYNDRYNPPGPTPSWYMYAVLEGDNSYGMMRSE